MKIICECGYGFTTDDDDSTVSFATESVVGILGPDEVRNDVHLSPSHDCPNCDHGSYVVMALNATRFTPAERRELEKFLLRFTRGHSSR